jgi:hypothetical protein
VTIPPAWAIVVATCPTTAWSGAVCKRIVIEYDEVVAECFCTGSASWAPGVTGK